ncbi:MAG: VWA domain-containing protein [Desulfuromonadaceae bacterium]|nr:VWA domain-containing protein [Desulfuromonadaceae bacterium]
MEFSQPLALWLLILLPVGLFGIAANERFVRQAQRVFLLSDSTAQQWRRTSRIISGGLALLSLIIALSGPQFWTMINDDPHHHLKLAVGIDVSKSMLAEDVLLDDPAADPSAIVNRLNTASLVALRLFEEMAGGQASLFLFARNSIEVVAPTRDQGFLRYMVQHTRLAEMTESGSDLKMAMATGADLIGDHSQTAGAVILISDGEDTENSLDELSNQAELMSSNGLPVYTIGIGQPTDVYIPIHRPGATAIEGFYTDSGGQHLRTRLQPANLQITASSSGGRYFALSDTEPRQLVDSLLKRIPQAAEWPIGSSRSRGLKDIAPLLIAMGLVFYVAHCLL